MALHRKSECGARIFNGNAQHNKLLIIVNLVFDEVATKAKPCKRYLNAF